MLPEFKDVIKAVAIAGLVIGAALGFASQAKAGPLDQGPHILVGQGTVGTLVTLAAFDDKRECLAARDDLIRQLEKFDERSYHSGRVYNTFLACIPGRNT